MSRSPNAGEERRWVALAVLLHVAISIVHGMAHAEAHVFLPPAATIFVYVVILAGPLAGLALTWLSPAAGGWVVALTLAGSCVFGIVNHFVLAGPDHVAYVAREWRSMFAATAVGLASTEALGSWLAIRLAWHGKEAS